MLNSVNGIKREGIEEDGGDHLHERKCSTLCGTDKNENFSKLRWRWDKFYWNMPSCLLICSH